MVLDKGINFRANEKTKFFSDKSKVNARDIHILGLKQYYKENPVLFKKVSLEWIEYRKRNLENQEMEKDYEIENLAKEAIKIMIEINDFDKSLKKYNIRDPNKFVSSFYEIKKLVELRGDIKDIGRDEWITNCNLCNSPLNDFKEACISLLEVCP